MASVAELGLVVLALLLCSLEQGHAGSVDTVGREFVFAIPTPYYPTSPYTSYIPKIYLVLTNPTNVTASVDITITSSTSTTSISERVDNRPANVTISFTDYFGRTYYTGADDPKTIRLSSTGDISVVAHYSYNQRYSSWYSTGMIILPVSALGTDHFIVSYRPYVGFKSEFTISATGVVTNVYIRGADGYRNQIILEPYETFQYRSSHDLTGSRITSDKPISVVSGVSSTRIPDGVKYSAYVAVQIPRVDGIGKDYILSPFKDRSSGYIFRVVGTENNTLITIVGLAEKPVELHAGEFYERVTTADNVIMITSSKPVYVCQYMKGYASESPYGNAAMVLVPALEMFPSSSLSFAASSLPSKSTRNRYSVSITVQCDNKEGLHMDGISLAHVWDELSSPNNRFCILRKAITVEDIHKISHTSPYEPFSVMVYASGYKVGYAFMAGYNVRNSTPPRVESSKLELMSDSQKGKYQSKSHAGSVDTVGREFVFAIPTPYYPTSRYTSYIPKIYLVLTNPTNVTASVDITITSSTSTTSISERVDNRPANVTISFTDYFGRTYYTGADDPKTIRLSSTGDISVVAHYSYNQRYSSWYSTGMIILPVSALGTDHFIVSYRPYVGFKSEFTISATGVVTNVYIRGADGYRNQIILEPYETFQYRSSHDLTGSRITSDKPISVVSGVSSTRIPDGVKYSAYFAVQIPRVDGIGKDYILSPFKDRSSGYIFRVVGTENNTLITIVGLAEKPVELHAGEFYERVTTADNVIMITSSKPVYVCQYMKGYASESPYGNAAMVLVPALEMFPSSSLSFAASSLPSKSTRNRYSVSITVQCDNKEGLHMDGISLAHVWDELSSPNNRFCILRKAITVEDIHKISHTSPYEPFSVMVYASGYKVGYAFMAGYNVRNSTPPRVESSNLELMSDSQKGKYQSKSHAGSVDTVGREFVFAIPTPYYPTSRYTSYIPKLYLVLTNPTNVTASVDITITSSTSTTSISKRVDNRPANVTISFTDYFGRTYYTSADDPKTIRLSSTGDISVVAHYSYNQRYSSWYSTGMIILPVSALGTDHFIVSYRPYVGFKSEFTISATGVVTNVYIRGADGYRNQIILEPYETFQYRSSHDLTGSRITSDKPISVVSGVSSTRIPDGVKYSAYFAVQIPRVDGIGKDYILSPFKDRSSGYIFRVVGTDNNTLITIVGLAEKPVELHAGEFYERVTTADNVIMITSSKPVYVCQYMKGYASESPYGNAAMVLVPGLEMFPSSSLSFAASSLPSKSTRNRYSVSITVQCDNKEGLHMDGISLAHVWEELSSPNNRFCILRKAITVEDIHKISHTSPEEPFSVMVYASGYKVGYAFMAGYNVRNSTPHLVEDSKLELIPESKKVVDSIFFEDHALASMQVRPELSVVDGSGFGHLVNVTFTLKMYHTMNYDMAYQRADFPVTVPVGKPIYLEAKASGGQLLVDSCLATNSSNPRSTPNIMLIDDGCPTDETVVYYSDAESSTWRFSTIAVTLSDGDNPTSVAYIHCWFIACNSSDSSTGCQRDCSSRRKRKSATTNEQSFEHYVVSLGPLNILSESNGQNEEDVTLPTPRFSSDP
ncbi:uncharacterized protein [Amphiura filiformis]|uniref:uncharacterized protein isoform X2 n=1 Tax=Amphiura filiformis TaxID=82378 RepID=UPI003B22062B